MDEVGGGFVLAAFGGLVSFLSPCVLPLVPAYLCFVAGTTLEELLQEQSEEADREHVSRTVMGALSFIAGFSTIFVSLGATASAISPVLLSHKQILGQVAGLIIFILGIHYAGFFRIAFLNREMRFAPDFAGGGRSSWSRMGGAYVVGLAFAFGWTPCIGPILAGILTFAATQESLAYGASMLVAYSLGLGIPFLVSALAMRRFLVFFQRFRNHLRKVEVTAGLCLAGAGVLMALGSFELVAIFLIETFPELGKLG